MKARINSAFKNVTAGKVGNKSIVRIAFFDGSAVRTLKSFTSPMSATANPESVSVDRNGGGIARTPPVLVSPTGGRSPYTYNWVKLTGSGTASAPNKASTAFDQVVQEGEFLTGTFRCTVTDSLGATAFAEATALFSAGGSTL